jgi:Uncharacterised nucleotidyltransferase
VSSPGMDPFYRLVAVRNLVIDRLAAEIAGAFAARGIESLVLKGPVLAEWLYPGEVRPYGDADLMVAPGNWVAAVALLTELGFSDHLGPMAHPRMESYASTAYLRGEDNLDLHCTLHGLDADPGRIWEAFSDRADTLAIGGGELRVPGRPALLLHVGLHAAHHAEGKALEDLRRGIERADPEDWDRAWELARRLDGAPTFASGLRLIPEGVELAGRLGIGEDVRSTRHDIRFEQIPTAEGIDALLAPGVGFGQRARTVAGEFFPKPEFMRWWSPLARRGRLGLLLSYPWRWARLLAQAPRGLLAVLRTRRGKGR